jgi:hypothetical protein
MFGYKYKIFGFLTGIQFPQQKRVQSNITMNVDPNQFVNIGVTALPETNAYHLYYAGEFVKIGWEVSDNVTAVTDKFNCYTLGGCCQNISPTNGTVNSVAMAASFMNETEIDSFFKFIG